MRTFAYLFIFTLLFSCSSDSTSDVIDNSNSGDQVDDGGNQGDGEDTTIVFTKLPGEDPTWEQIKIELLITYGLHVATTVGRYTMQKLNPQRIRTRVH